MKSSQNAAKNVPYRAADSLGMADEVVYADSPKVSCDGGKGALGHPLIYLDMQSAGSITCPYCSRQFVLSEHH